MCVGCVLSSHMLRTPPETRAPRLVAQLAYDVLVSVCRKALRAQAQALAEQPFSREAYARDPKQARPRNPGLSLSDSNTCVRSLSAHWTST